MSAFPFITGVRYRVISEIEELGHVFKSGWIVIFNNSSYDAHNGVTRFWFIREGSNELIAWHAWDDGPPTGEQSKKIFEQIIK